MEIANTIFENGTLAKICFASEDTDVALLVLDDQMHSAIHCKDESLLFFDYCREISKTLDKEFAPGMPIKVLTLGGGGYSIPRYIEATRPKSAQRVVEINHELIQFIDSSLPLKKGSLIEVICNDAYTYVMNEEDESQKYNFIFFDVYVEPYLEKRFFSYEFLEKLTSLVLEGGLVVMNIIDDSDTKKLLQQLKNIFKVGASFVEIKILTPETPQGKTTGNRNVLLSYRSRA